MNEFEKLQEEITAGPVLNPDELEEALRNGKEFVRQIEHSFKNMDKIIPAPLEEEDDFFDYDLDEDE